jgi:large subunit ribosomal protein L9
MATKLLLVQDVVDLGRSGEIVSVKPGYARNFLVPKRLAVVADKGTLRMQARLLEERQKRALEERAEAQEVANRLVDAKIEKTVKVDPEGHLYGSVTIVDILELIKASYNVTLEKKTVTLKAPIKTLGEHLIELKLHDDVSVKVTLDVLKESI